MTANVAKLPLCYIQLLASIADIAKSTSKAVLKRMSKSNATSFVRMRAAFKRLSTATEETDDENASAAISTILAEYLDDKEAFEATRADEVAELQAGAARAGGGDNDDSSDFGSSDSDDSSSGGSGDETGESGDGSDSETNSESNSDTGTVSEPESESDDEEDNTLISEVRRALQGRWKYVKIDQLPKDVVDALPQEIQEKLTELLQQLASGGRTKRQRQDKVGVMEGDDNLELEARAMPRFNVADYWLSLARECEAMP